MKSCQRENSLKVFLERKLALLLRVGFSSKEIAPLLNISTKSVEIARYRLRKKFDLKKEINLTEFIKTI